MKENRIEFRKCICVNKPEIPAMQIGDTFFYCTTISSKKLGLSIQLYDNNPLAYRVHNGKHIASMDAETFQNHFKDIVEFREEQIEKILE